MEPSHRSIVPNIAGVPWWAAVLVAVGLTAVGYAFDAGHKELTHTFAGFYIAGCVAAILAVRQAAVFTAVIQPPLILFCTVPGAYWLFHGGKVDKFKDLLINCGYPLIERFPLMLGTAGLVLFIGLIRWYFGKNSRTAATADKAMDSTAAKEDATERPSFISGLVAKVSSLLAGDTADEDSDAAADAPPAHAKRRAASSSRAGRTASRSAQRPARSRSRHARPDDSLESDGDRPRRAARRSAVPREYADYDPTDPPPRPRRRRPPGDDELGAPPPREMRREPHPRRNPYERSYERPERRSSRFDPYESYDRPEPSERGERRSRHERRGGGYEPYPPYEPRSRRAAPSGSTSNPTHHPISQVRYRGQPPYSEPRDEPRSDRRSRSPRSSSRRPQTETWEYDS